MESTAPQPVRAAARRDITHPISNTYQLRAGTNRKTGLADARQAPAEECHCRVVPCRTFDRFVLLVHFGRVMGAPRYPARDCEGAQRGPQAR
jgi:hypothetical protein